jgi:small subunit ribosomal protein S16
MSVRLRLARRGTTKSPFFHLVVADGRAPRDGSFIEQVGTYDPRVSPPIVKLESERIQHWIARGAQPTDAVYDLMRHAKPNAAKPDTVALAPKASRAAKQPAKSI